MKAVGNTHSDRQVGDWLKIGVFVRGYVIILIITILFMGYVTLHILTAQ